MTYYEKFSSAKTEEQLKSMMKQEAEIAMLFLGGNPDRIKAIEDAGNRVSDENGWMGVQ